MFFDAHIHSSGTQDYPFTIAICAHHVNEGNICVILCDVSMFAF